MFSAATSLFIAVTAIATVAQPAEPGLEWTVTLDSEVEWQRATPAGVLILGTRSGVVALDGASGKTLWRIDDLKQPDNERLDVLPRPPYVVLQLERGMRGDAVRLVIDAMTGREVWNSATLGLTDVDRQLYVPALDALMLSGRQGKAGVAVVADLATGRRLRTLGDPGKGRNPDLRNPLLFDTDSTLVVATESVLTRYNLVTGATEWVTPRLKDGRRKPCKLLPETPRIKGVKLRAPGPLPPPVALQLASDGRRIFVFHGYTLQVVDATNGKPLWNAPPALCDPCARVLEAGGGVVAWTVSDIAGNDEIVMIDGASGKVRWQYPRRPHGFAELLKATGTPVVPLANPLVASGALLTLSGQDLVRIDLWDGESSRIGRISFEESDGAPAWLDSTGDGLLVMGQRDFEWLDGNGRSLRHVRYDAPGGNLGEGLTLLKATTFSEEESGRRADGHMVTMRVKHLSPIDRLVRQFDAMSSLDSMLFALDDLKDGDPRNATLVALDRRTGTVSRRVPVSSPPRYTIDLPHRRVFVLEKQTVRCHPL